MKLISTLVCVLFFLQVNAQGWDRTLTDSLRISSIAPTNDGGCVILGNDLVNRKIVVLKVNALGNKQWLKLFPDVASVNEPYQTGVVKIIQDNDGNYWFGISTYSLVGTPLTKLDKDGNRLLFRILPMKSVEIFSKNNQLIIFGVNTTTNQTTLLRLNANGDTLNINPIPTISFTTSANYTAVVQENSILMFGAANYARSYTTRKISFDGTILQQTSIPASVLPYATFPPTQMIKMLDGSVLIPDSMSLIKIDSMGAFVWRKPINIANFNLLAPISRYALAPIASDGSFMAIKNNPTNRYLDIQKYSKEGVQLSSFTWFYENSLNTISLTKTVNNSYVVTGNTVSNKMRLIRLDGNGYFYPYFIKGNVFSDRDNNCQLTSGDIPLQRVFITGKRTGFPDVVALTDSLGRYNLNVDIYDAVYPLSIEDD
jgi:hypothetical protein